MNQQVAMLYFASRRGPLWVAVFLAGIPIGAGLWSWEIAWVGKGSQGLWESLFPACATGKSPPLAALDAGGVDRSDSSETLAEEAGGEQVSFRSARHFLDFLGVSTSDFGDLVDGKPWQETEERLLHKLLFHLARHIDWGDLERWAVRSADWDSVLRQVESFRGEVFLVEGMVRSAVAIDLAPEVAARLGFRQFFRAVIEPVESSCDHGPAAAEGDLRESNSCSKSVGGALASPEERRQSAREEEEQALQHGRDVRFSIFALDLPKAWLGAENLRERGAALALFTKIGEKFANKTTVYLVAKRMAWYPESVLGRLRMDVGLFDLLDRPLPPEAVREVAAPAEVARFRLGPHNRECFYQLLAAVGRARPGQLLREAQSELRRQGRDRSSVVPLFNEPASQRGQLVLLTGTAREVLRVDVSDQDVRERFGISHYYQIHLFTEDSQGNPLVVCVRELPRDMPVGSGPDYAETLMVAGFFFNTWAYRRQAENSAGSEKYVWQLAPLIIARDVVWLPRPRGGAGPWVTLLATLVMVIVLVAIWWGMLQASRSVPRSWAERPK